MTTTSVETRAKFNLEMKKPGLQGRKDVEQTSFRTGPNALAMMSPAGFGCVYSQFLQCASLPPCGPTCCTVKYYKILWTLR